MTSCDGCKQKGLCCSFSILESETMWLLPNYTCKYLDHNTNLCTIFSNRFKVNPECGSMEVMQDWGGMPDKCNYHVEMKFKYRAKIASPKNEKRLFKKMKKLWSKIGFPISFDPKLSRRVL